MILHWLHRPAAKDCRRGTAQTGNHHRHQRRHQPTPIGRFRPADVIIQPVSRTSNVPGQGTYVCIYNSQVYLYEAQSIMEWDRFWPERAQRPTRRRHEPADPLSAAVSASNNVRGENVHVCIYIYLRIQKKSPRMYGTFDGSRSPIPRIHVCVCQTSRRGNSATTFDERSMSCKTPSATTSQTQSTSVVHTYHGSSTISIHPGCKRAHLFCPARCLKPRRSFIWALSRSSRYVLPPSRMSDPTGRKGRDEQGLRAWVLTYPWNPPSCCSHSV
jgi:hypothetical protein